MPAIPAHLVAAVDQHRAALRDLVRLAHDHHRHGCDLPDACAGRDVRTVIELLDSDRVASLAFTAIAELAKFRDDPPTDDLPTDDLP
jgi:hypothetical protein